MARLNAAGRGEVDWPGLSAADIAGLAGTPAVVFGSTYVSGVATTFLRTDDQIKFPTSLLSSANASTLTLTDDATDQTLTGSLGAINLRSGSGSMTLDKWTGGGTVAAVNGVVLGFVASTTILGTTLRTGMNAQITVNDASTYTTATFTGAQGIVAASNSIVAGVTYTNVSLKALTAQIVTATHSTNTHVFTERTGVNILLGAALQSGSGAVTVTDTHGIRVSGYPIAGTGGTQTNARSARLQLPTIGETIRRGCSVETTTSNVGTEAANVEGYYCEDIPRGTAQRANYYAEGATTGTPTDVYGFFQGTAHVVGTNRYGARYTGATTGTPTLCVGVQADAHVVGTTKRSFVGADPAQFGGIVMDDATDIVVNATTGTKIGTATTQKLGFWNKAPVVQPAAYTPTNVTTDRAYDANATTLDEIADVLGTLITDLQTIGLVG